MVKERTESMLLTLKRFGEIMDPMTNKGTKMTTLTHTEISNQLELASAITLAHFGSYAYAAGMFQTQLSMVLVTLPRHKQLEVLTSIKSITAQYEQKVA